MKKITLLFLALLIVLSSCSSREFISQFRMEKIDEHIQWRLMKTDELNDSPAFINILDIDLNKFDGDIDIAWYKDTLIKTSVIAEDHSAFAAVNGSFFDMKVGGAVVYLQDNGKKISDNYDKKSFCSSGAFALDTNGVIMIIKRPETGWSYSPAFSDIMASGPILIHNDQVCEQDPIPFNLRRHPRTVIGITDTYHLLLVTVDGRTKDASGMTIKELTKLMRDLNCKNALNLDGGGSTTMYIRDKTANGVVNCPSDNKKFDHDGERSVANAIVIKSYQRSAISK